MCNSLRLNRPKVSLPGPHPWVAVFKGHTVQDRVRQAQLLEAVTPKAALHPTAVKSSMQPMYALGKGGRTARASH